MAITHKALPLNGSANLNFNVVGGTSAPANPRDNTIWVNTATKINKWMLRPDAPVIESNNHNTIIYPYVETTKTANGITFTDNVDGSITVNGTATAASSFNCTSKVRTGTGVIMDYLPAGTYTLSGLSDNVVFSITCNDNSVFGSTIIEISKGQLPYTFTTNSAFNYRLSLKVNSGVTVNNEVCYPQIERGTEATSYIKGDISHMDGNVWIQTLNSGGTIIFNALKKKHMIDTQLFAAYQWNGSEWANKEAYCYYDETWQQFSFSSINILAITAGSTSSTTTPTTSNIITNINNYTTVVIDNVVATGGNYGKNRARLYIDNAVVLDTSETYLSADYRAAANAWSGSFPISQNGSIYVDVYTARKTSVDDHTNPISITVNFHFE